MNKEKDFSEKKFQEDFVAELRKYKWESPDELDGNKQTVTVDDLINHWRSELNRINADQLEGVALTDNEFKQVMAKVSMISNSYEAAKILAIEESTGKIDGIYRDDHPSITRKQITLTIFKKASVRGGDSSYKIAREVVSPNSNRFDLVLLINGLPLINIEQKRTDKTLDEAFGQFKRYYRDGEFVNNFMAFSQMMVITSEIDSRYFATPKSIDGFNLSFVFRWADRNNNPVVEWRKIIKHFLMIPMAHQMVGDYLVIDEAQDEENRKHMVLRPYQVYALQAVEAAAMGWGNDGIKQGGYVWHTTGSGKTITSFKTALFLSTRGNFDKVVFLVDRRELDQKTSENFKAYAAYEAVSVDDTPHTYHLRKQLNNAKRGIIVTTTFKLNSLVCDLIEAQDCSLADKNLVFIIDEAHRTTMGTMMVTIKEYFKKNSLFYGFTGTPLFNESKATGMINQKSEVIDTTEKLFGPMLHKYTIDQAISDGNVLGFHIDYINTGEFTSYDDLREQIALKLKQESPDLEKIEIERQVQLWDELEVEMQAVKHGLLRYDDETHIPRVVERILSNWDFQSQDREFNAILTVAYRQRVITYYNEFKKQMENQGIWLNIAMTFSYGNENDPDNIPPEIVENMYKDYAKFTGIRFSPEQGNRSEDAHFQDIVERTTRGGSGRNPKNIDLVIVADRLLTGYDSKRLNTLYIDRSLELHGLVQAYSRTNRVYGKEKEFGTIINFQYPRITEKAVKDALILYGSGGTSSKAIVEPYSTAVEKFSLKVRKLKSTLHDPTMWIELKDKNEELEAFLLAFRDASNQLNLVMQYYEYKWEDVAFGIDEHTWLQYVGAYKNLKPSGAGPDIISPQPLVGKTKLAGTQVIDAAHILKIIGDQVTSEDGIQTVDTETLRIIHEEIEELSNMGDHEQALLLKEFVDTELLKKQIPSTMRFDDAFENWKRKKKEYEIQEFAENWGISSLTLSDSIEAYSITRPEVIPYIEDITNEVNYKIAKDKSSGSRLKHVMSLTFELPKWIPEIKQKYD